MDPVITIAPQSSGARYFVAHYIHTSWMVLGAVIAVIAGFTTLNMFMADSGMAVLNEHAAPVMTFFARLTRQV